MQLTKQTCSPTAIVCGTKKHSEATKGVAIHPHDKRCLLPHPTSLVPTIFARDRQRPRALDDDAAQRPQVRQPHAKRHDNTKRDDDVNALRFCRRFSRGKATVTLSGSLTKAVAFQLSRPCAAHLPTTRSRVSRLPCSRGLGTPRRRGATERSPRRRIGAARRSYTEWLTKSAG